MSSLAMADLLNHYLATGDKRLVAIETVGEEVVKPSEGMNVWCGVVWCGVVWCGVVWCGVVWRCVVWCSVVRCGDVCQALSPSVYL